MMVLKRGNSEEKLKDLERHQASEHISDREKDVQPQGFCKIDAQNPWWTAKNKQSLGKNLSDNLFSECAIY